VNDNLGWLTRVDATHIRDYCPDCAAPRLRAVERGTWPVVVVREGR
jgi:hypothetical protein